MIQYHYVLASRQALVSSGISQVAEGTYIYTRRARLKGDSLSLRGVNSQMSVLILGGDTHTRKLWTASLALHWIKTLGLVLSELNLSKLAVQLIG